MIRDSIDVLRKSRINCLTTTKSIEEKLMDLGMNTDELENEIKKKEKRTCFFFYIIIYIYNKLI